MQENVIDILKRVGAIITDSHIVGTSGRHMSVYINKDALFPHTQDASKVGLLFAQKYQHKNIDVVVGPAMGGIILAQWTAYHLSELTGKTIFGVYTDKTSEGDQIFKRGYDKFVTGKRVLVLEDLTTTGGSMKKVIDTVRNTGGKIIAACVMVNRDKKLVNAKTMGVPLGALGYFPAESYLEQECPLCAQKVPINTTVGHGKQFLEKQKKNL